MQRLKHKGKIVFVFSDPGGAKPCLALIEESNLTNVIAISDREHSFYKDFNTPVEILTQGFEDFIDAIKPELIFTATSYRSDIEQQFIKIALKRSIACYSFVDHWTSILKRFEDAAGEIVLPNQVWVIDERAKLLAIEQGIDEDKIVISGNPYHDWLSNWEPAVSKDNFISQIGLTNKNKKLLVYAPDPLSNINGKDIYGFDELSATLELVNLFDEHKIELKDWIVLVKAHPNQNREELNKVIHDHTIFKPLANDIDTNTCIYYADIVMGFFSSFLIEAAIMHKPVIRFFNKSIENDPIAELNIGTIVNKTTIISNLKSH